MKIWMVAMALLGLASAAPAEEYQCTQDAGCTARITEDGVVREVQFREHDIVSTEAGWDVFCSACTGWSKVKTHDNAPNTPAPPSGPRTTFIYDNNHAGTTLSYGSSSIVFYGVQSLASGAGGSQGDTYECSWKHDSDGAGPRQPVTVTVRTERRSGETIREHARRFGAMVDEMQDLFPPNVAESP